MPISYKLRSVFIHIPKSAGTSITHMLREADRSLAYVGETPSNILAVTRERWLQHLTAVHLIDLLPNDTWNAYFKFAFVRNPYDLVVSYYLYHRERVRTSVDFRRAYPVVTERFYGDPSFVEWVKRGLYMPTQRSFLVDKDGRLAVDYVGRFETLGKGIAFVAGVIGVRPVLLHLRSSIRTVWPTYYSPEAREAVRRHFWEDFAEFGYSTSCFGAPEAK